MAATPWQSILREVESGRRRPFYLIVGDEPFQTQELLNALKRLFIKNEEDAVFSFETWDGEHLDAAGLLAALETLPGLFDTGGAGRLVVCQHFERVPVTGIEILAPYFERPLESTCFVMVATKVDKRKGWVRAIDERGAIIEVNEPYERDWPRWIPYFERRVGKRLDPEMWPALVEQAQHKLSLVWSELQTLATFVGEERGIALPHLLALTSASGSADVFGFADEVIEGDALGALKKFQSLLWRGESEVKLLAILLRQFRLLEQCVELTRRGVQDSKLVASQIGVSPFFVPKLMRQAKHFTASRLDEVVSLLADCDFRLKTGEGQIFSNFLIPYFSQRGKLIQVK